MRFTGCSEEIQLPWLIAGVCVVLGLQFLMLMDRKLTWRQRLHSLGYGGDGLLIWIVLGLFGAAIGSVIGGVAFDSTGEGVWIGAAVASVWWLSLVLRTSSVTREKSDPKHRDLNG